MEIRFLNIFLTSAGFDNKEILRRFVESLPKTREFPKLLFVPTAAITDGGREMLPFCRQEIADAGFPETGVLEVQISEIASLPELSAYRVIYVAGGDTEHLVDEMNKHNFRETLDCLLEAGGTYFGVSAGSIALTNSFPGCLNYINCKLSVHQNIGTKPGPISLRDYSEISLTDNQAIVIHPAQAEIVG